MCAPRSATTAADTYKPLHVLADHVGQGGGQHTKSRRRHQQLGGFDNSKTIHQAGVKQFGSGWVWLVRHQRWQVRDPPTPNQDNPLMDGKDDFPSSATTSGARLLPALIKRRPDYAPRGGAW